MNICRAPCTVLGPRDPGMNKIGKVAMLMELAFSYKLGKTEDRRRSWKQDEMVG